MHVHLDCSPPVVNSIESYSCQRISEQKAMRSKELPVEFRFRIVSRHSCGESFKRNSTALKVPESTVAFIMLKWRTFAKTRIRPRAGCPVKLSNQRRRALIREVTKNLSVALAELQRSCMEMQETS